MDLQSDCATLPRPGEFDFMAESRESLEDAARQLAAALASHGRRVVFAESCTAGLASAALAAVPGISEWHCGSAVTYREQTKIEWLGLAAQEIAEHNVVSEFVAREMARRVLRRTSEADVSGAITGHLGPHAPESLDGVVHIAVAWWGADRCLSIVASRHQLASGQRGARQAEAARLLLERVRHQLDFPD